MATLDPATDIGRVRLLISDNGVQYTDDQIQAFLVLSAPYGLTSVYRAAALALRSWARTLMNPDVVLGDYQQKNAGVASAMLALATQYITFEEEMPAFGIVEDNLSGFNELAIIRNWVLRTET